MARWPVELVAKRSEIPLKLHEPVPEGDKTYATFVTLDGERTPVIVCPRCAEEGHCGGHESTVSGDKLTIRPSLMCSCGGHYWLTDGVLSDV